MKESLNRFNTKAGVAALMCAALLVAGCTSTQPAPIRQSAPVTPGGAAVVRQATPGTHIVRSGETLMGIGRAYGQSVSDLVAWNGLRSADQLAVGQQLRVAPSNAVAVTKPVSPSGSGVAVTPIKQQPRGGTQPYSEQAWSSARSPQSSATPSAATPAGSWVWPASGAVIERFNDTTNKGVDIAGNPGDPVIAAAAGKVAYAGTGLRGYGKLIIINHSSEFITAYAHNQTLLVKEGDTVAKGQKIAEIGSTDANRPKLHFELRRKGKPVNPELYLPKVR